MRNLPEPRGGEPIKYVNDVDNVLFVTKIPDLEEGVAPKSNFAANERWSSVDALVDTRQDSPSSGSSLRKRSSNENPKQREEKHEQAKEEKPTLRGR